MIIVVCLNVAPTLKKTYFGGDVKLIELRF